MVGGAAIRSFEDLDCWKACRDFKLFSYSQAKKFPPEEKYAAAADLRKTCRSVTQNIAEGYGRFSYQENIQFCRIGRASLYETLDLLIDCRDLNYFTESEMNQVRMLFEKSAQLLNGYINYIEKKKGDK